MKKLIISLILIFAFTSLSLAKANLGASVDFGAFNIKANADLEKFKANISLNFKVPRVKIETMMNEVKMQPADVYLAAELVKMSNKDVDTVVTQYQVNRGKGWGVIAKSLGIKPGSKEFHALKRKMKQMKKGQNPNGVSANDDDDDDDEDDDAPRGKGKGKGKGHKNR